MEPWFPRPGKPADLLVESSGRFPVPGAEIYRWLTDPQAEEWKSRVGVGIHALGSAKTTVRLLRSNGWVFKTNTHSLCFDTADALAHYFDQSFEHYTALPFWHPDKFWFGIRSGGKYWLLNGTPELITLRELSNPDAILRRWSEMFFLGALAHHQFGCMLDINPSNFGFVSEDGPLYYLDDEIYAPSRIDQFAMAILQRLPELQASGIRVAAFGLTLRNRLYGRFADAAWWHSILVELAELPLVSVSDQDRQALVTAMLPPPEGDQLKRKFYATPPQTFPYGGETCVGKRTLILADIHSNWTALEAVLQAAAPLGYDHILILGDLLGYGPHPLAVLQWAQGLRNATVLGGNHDYALAKGMVESQSFSHASRAWPWTLAQLTAPDRDWLGALPDHLRQGDVMCVHASLLGPNYHTSYIYEMTYRQNLQEAEAQGLRLVWFGHSHVPAVYAKTLGKVEYERLPLTEPINVLAPERVLLINPGSVGQPRDRNPKASFAIWDHGTQSVSFHRAAYDTQSVCQAIQAANLLPQLAERLAKGE